MRKPQETPEYTASVLLTCCLLIRWVRPKTTEQFKLLLLASSWRQSRLSKHECQAAWVLSDDWDGVVCAANTCYEYLQWPPAIICVIAAGQLVGQF